jgi:hypothetical protein
MRKGRILTAARDLETEVLHIPAGHRPDIRYIEGKVFEFHK